MTAVPEALAAGLPLLLIRSPQVPEELWEQLPDGRRLILHRMVPGAVQRAQQQGWGLHLPGTEAVAPWRRRFAGILGKSCHNRAEANHALAEGADYVLLSPIFSPTSKPEDRRPPLGLEVLRKGRGIYALGGITPENAGRCIDAGASGVAVLGGIFGRPDVSARVRAYGSVL